MSLVQDLVSLLARELLDALVDRVGRQGLQVDLDSSPQLGAGEHGDARIRRQRILRGEAPRELSAQELEEIKAFGNE